MISFQIRLMGATSLLLLTIMLNYSKQGWLRSVATHWLWSSTPTSYQVATKKSQIHRICKPPAQQIWCQKSSDASLLQNPIHQVVPKIEGFNMFQRFFHNQNNENRLWNTPTASSILVTSNGFTSNHWDILDSYPFSSWWFFTQPTNPSEKNMRKSNWVHLSQKKIRVDNKKYFVWNHHLAFTFLPIYSSTTLKILATHPTIK